MTEETPPEEERPPRPTPGRLESHSPYPQDYDLTADARSYVLSLRSRDAREAARDYARMDDQLFRARVGPAIDDVLAELKAIRRVAENPPVVSKKQVAGLLAAGGIVLEAVSRGIEAWRGSQ